MFANRNVVSLVVAVGLIALAAVPARGNKNWVGTGTGNWSDPANWSDTAGGPGGAGVPQLGEAVSLWTTDAGNQGIILDVSANVSTFGIAATHHDGTVDFHHLSGSDLQTTLTRIGRYYGETFYHQYGGSHSTDFLDIATTSGDDATYAISGGTLSASRMDIGYSGSGTFLHSGGTVNVGTMQLARGHAYSGGGTYVMNGTGASLIVAGNETISYRSHGYFYQSAGNHLVQGTLYVGARGGGEGAYDMSGGSLTVDTLLAVGTGYGKGTFTHGGGTIITESLDVGLSYGGRGYYDLSGETSVLTVNGNERFGGETTFTQSAGMHFIGGSVIGQAYTLSGGTYTLGGSEFAVGSFNQTGGHASFTSPSVKVYYTTYELAGGTFSAPALQTSRFIWSGGHLDVGTLYVSGGMTVTFNSERTAVVNALSHLPGYVGNIDLTNNDLIIDYDVDPSTQIADVRSFLGDGKLWTSAAGTSHRLGYADNADPLLQRSTFSGQTFPANDFSQLLIMYTFGGDANLDGAVNLIDLVALANHWQASDAFWVEGDFNYDGVVNHADLGILATNWNTSQAVLDEALVQHGLPAVAIPEPAMPGVGMFILMIGGRRRRRVGHA